MVETGNNKHNFGHPEGFCQFLKIQDFLRGQNLNFPQKCRFFFTRLNSKIYQLQEKSLWMAEITGLKKGVRNLEVGCSHMDLRIWVKAELIY